MQNNGTKIVKPLGGHNHIPFWGRDDNRITEEGTTFFFHHHFHLFKKWHYKVRVNSCQNSVPCNQVPLRLIDQDQFTPFTNSAKRYKKKIILSLICQFSLCHWEKLILFISQCERYMTHILYMLESVVYV